MQQGWSASVCMCVQGSKCKQHDSHQPGREAQDAVLRVIVLTKKCSWKSFMLMTPPVMPLSYLQHNSKRWDGVRSGSI